MKVDSMVSLSKWTLTSLSTIWKIEFLCLLMPPSPGRPRRHRRYITQARSNGSHDPHVQTRQNFIYGGVHVMPSDVAGALGWDAATSLNHPSAL